MSRSLSGDGVFTAVMETDMLRRMIRIHLSMKTEMQLAAPEKASKLTLNDYLV